MAEEGGDMFREVQEAELVPGSPLKAALVDELGFLIADAGTIFQTADECKLLVQGGRCFWEHPREAREADQAMPPLTGRYGLPVGTLLHVKPPTDPGRAATSRLVGFSSDAVFIAWPKLGGLDADITNGEVVLFRGFSGTTIHSFSGKIHAVSRTPFPLWMLTEIFHAEAREMRGTIRVPTRIVGSLQSGGTAEHLTRTVLIGDLSLGGANVRTADEGLEDDSPITLSFRLRAGSIDARVSLNGRVNPSCKPATADPGGSFGITFDAPSERETLLLQCFIYEQLLASATMRPSSRLRATENG